MHEHKVSQKDLGTQSFSLIPSRSKLKKLLELSSHYLLKPTPLGLKQQKDRLVPSAELDVELDC